MWWISSDEGHVAHERIKQDIETAQNALYDAVPPDLAFVWRSLWLDGDDRDITANGNSLV